MRDASYLRDATGKAPLSAFRLFAAIDQQHIGDDRTGWTAVVLGVHTNGSESWLQVAAQHDPSRSIVLPRTASSQHCARTTAPWSGITSLKFLGRFEQVYLIR